MGDFLDFLGSLVLFTALFEGLIVLPGRLLARVAEPVGRPNPDRDAYMTLAYHVATALVYTALVAYFSAWVSTLPRVTFPFGYALGGFAFTYAWLGRMATVLARRRDDRGRAAAAAGAALGMILALALYPLLFTSPHLVFAIPWVGHAYRYALGVYGLLQDQWIVWLATAIFVFVMLVRTAAEVWRQGTKLFATAWRGLGLSPVLLWLRGWLLLVGVFVTGMPVWLLAQIGATTELARGEMLKALTTRGGPGYHPLWGPLILGELAASLALMVWSCVLLVTFFARHACFPALATWFLAALVLLSAVDVVTGLVGPSGALTIVELGGLTRTTIVGVVGVLYLRRSGRVAATFDRSVPAATA